MTNELRDIVGDRGEMIFKLAITDFRATTKPLFRASFLGDKWPVVDFYVELLGMRKCRAGLFTQVKSTTLPIPAGATHIQISLPKTKCQQLYRVPGPTYLVAVHEPTNIAYIKSIHTDPIQGVTQVALANVLNGHNLQVLYDEVKQFWSSRRSKPTTSVFI